MSLFYKRTAGLALCTLFSATSLYAQQSITGIVSDANGPISGVTVTVKGTTKGTQTIANGSFTIQAAQGETLRISIVGYKTQEIVVGSNKAINITLTSDAAALDEVVVTAMGIKRESKALGYAVSNIKADEITKAGNTNFGSALYGKAPGVKITTAPGGSASAVNVQIRGINSLNYQRQPLYVVDGIIIRNDQQNGAAGANNNNFDRDQRIRGNGMLDINPADIDNISILKGAAASALYGSDAASGVIVITTKKGTKGRGLGVDFNYTGSLSAQRFYQNFKMNMAQAMMQVSMLPMALLQKVGFLILNPRAAGDLTLDPTQVLVQNLREKTSCGGMVRLDLMSHAKTITMMSSTKDTTPPQTLEYQIRLKNSIIV
ncbi:TonB-dependent receptor plug domain-containing protein [Sphingobacterium sp. E70]|uniref:carboxypeptidase-like regulatory domain-containing protein n=1 Tax=Sphingobacterium sp. E70 TaxID=2853439 RepID=UPI00211C4504|nr:carboxypeptidase-like regulatory domain-containing protein [Sphingobacterium sp. E70]ULT27602.1 TonB-dependent receptor plug domain-containing protein [Sphingobacterium sp. E70]